MLSGQSVRCMREGILLKLLLPSLLILLLLPLTQDESASAYAVESANSSDCCDDHSLSDVLFIQYRGVFRDLLARKCVYYPSCSHYAQEAIRSHGAAFGLIMALERWTRCTSSAFSYGDYRITYGNKLEDQVNPGEEVTCWGRFLLPF